MPEEPVDHLGELLFDAQDRDGRTPAVDEEQMKAQITGDVDQPFSPFGEHAGGGLKALRLLGRHQLLIMGNLGDALPGARRVEVSVTTGLRGAVRGLEESVVSVGADHC